MRRNWGTERFSNLPKVTQKEVDPGFKPKLSGWTIFLFCHCCFSLCHRKGSSHFYIKKNCFNHSKLLYKSSVGNPLTLGYIGLLETTCIWSQLFLNIYYCFLTSGMLLCLTISSWGRSWGWFIAIVDLHVLNNSTVTDFKGRIWDSWMGNRLSQTSVRCFQYTMGPPVMQRCRTNLSETQFHPQEKVSVQLWLWGCCAMLNVTIQGNTKHSAWHTAVNNECWPFPFKDRSRLKSKKFPQGCVGRESTGKRIQIS